MISSENRFTLFRDHARLEDPGGFEPLAHGLKIRSISIQV